MAGRELGDGKAGARCAEVTRKRLPEEFREGTFIERIFFSDFSGRVDFTHVCEARPYRRSVCRPTNDRCTSSGPS